MLIVISHVLGITMRHDAPPIVREVLATFASVPHVARLDVFGKATSSACGAAGGGFGARDDVVLIGCDRDHRRTREGVGVVACYRKRRDRVLSEHVVEFKPTILVGPAIDDAPFDERDVFAE